VWLELGYGKTALSCPAYAAQRVTHTVSCLYSVDLKMANIPTLITYRLTLRPFNLADASGVQELAGEWDVARTTVNIPHPYEHGMAEEWISTQVQTFENEQGVTFAIELRSESLLIGAIGLIANKVHRWAELVYWTGKPYWNHGYCTEAAKEACVMVLRS
jgi:ribosomal-protein-alanine N-acetyltransferase